MKLAVFGSRNINDEEFVVGKVNDYITNLGEGVTLLMGGAAGVQSIVKEGLQGHYDIVTFKPWHIVDTKLEFVTKLFFMRNKQIIDNSHRLLVVVKKGEEDSEVDKAISYAHKKGKQVDIIEYK